MLNLTKFTGINNVLPEERLGPDALTVAQDVDVGLTGELRRRGGYSVAAEGCHKNLFEASDYLLATRMGGELVAISGLQTTSLHPALGLARVWYCQLPDGRVAFSNGSINGITDGVGLTSWGVPLPDDLGAVTPTGGALPPGEYRYALTHTRLSDGLEGGAVFSPPFQVVDGGVLLLGLPERQGHAINVYLTTAGGDEFYFAGTTAGGAFSYLGDAQVLVVPCPTAFLHPPPVGTVAAVWRGRVLLACASTLYASQYGQWELFDLARDFKQFGAPITLIQPVDDGVYVGTEQELVFLAGTEFDSLRYVPLLPEPVVLGSGVAVRGDLVALGEGQGNGAAMLCIVGGCVLAGFNSGSVNRLTYQRYRTAAREVAATFREVGGVPQYIAIPQ